jgi:PHD/YefM family antitoxin component YafN of YafNO toxin-antitoxin module
MQKTNALAMRRNLGRVLRQLERSGEPVLVERNREPKAVLISIGDFRERFVDKVAAAEREALVEEILASRKRAPKARQPAVALVRELRGPLP